MSSLRLTRRGRVVLFLLAAIIGISSVFAASSAVAGDRLEDVDVKTATVMAGETLWSHARAMTPSSKDVRDTVRLIMDLNDLPTAEVRAGQQILLPTSLD